MSGGDSNSKYFVKALAVIALAIFVVMVTVFVTWWLLLDRTMTMHNLDGSSAKIMATTLFFQKLQSLGSISLTLIGVAWAFLLYKETNMEVPRWEQKLLFGVTNLFLAASFMSYSVGYDFLVDRIFLYATIDFGTPVVEIWNWAQVGFFLCGVTSLGLTMIVCKPAP